jgi:hypothetical protein
MTSEPLSSTDDQVVIEPQGAGEWIASGPPGGRALHVYRLAARDWLVSEVGRGSEGRGADLPAALAALAARVRPGAWWDGVAEALSRSRPDPGGPGTPR